MINEELTASDEAYKIFGIRKDADMPSLDAIITVSYTHLDVYKRQIHTRSFRISISRSGKI